MLDLIFGGAVAAALLLYLPAPAGSVESNPAESNA